MSNKGKVLFIVHDVYQEDNVFPLNIGYLSAVLKKYGADVTVCCQDVFHYTNEELADKFLKNHDYDLIGIGFMAARFKETILDLCETINKYKKNAKLILGGHGPSPIPEHVLKTTQADIVAIGEAEETIIDVLEAIINNSDLQDVKGIAYRKGEKIFINERRKPVKRLDSLPFPAWDLFPMAIYTTNMNYMGKDQDEKAFQIITSRGCVNRCAFCYRMEKSIRFRSMENVLEEMKILYEKYNVTYFVILDELFVPNIKRLERFIDGLRKNDLLHKIKYNIDVGIRADVATDEFAQLLKDSGCAYVNIGFESVTQKCLDELNKNTKVSDNYKTADLMRKYKIPMGINFIWGIMSDNEKTLRDSVDFIKKYNSYDELRTIRPITPYPGCELYDYAISKKLLSDDNDFFERFENSDLITVNFTNLPDKKFYNLLFEANKELIIDHFTHTNKDMKEADQIINDFYNLYFKGFTKFRGARHIDKKNEEITVSKEI